MPKESKYSLFEHISPGLFLTFLGNFWYRYNWEKLAPFFLLYWEKIVQFLAIKGEIGGIFFR